MKQRWNWRDVLTEDEAATVREHDAAQDAVKRAREHADKTRLAFDRIRNRALQRAKYAAIVEATKGRKVDRRI